MPVLGTTENNKRLVSETGTVLGTGLNCCERREVDDDDNNNNVIPRLTSDPANEFFG